MFPGSGSANLSAEPVFRAAKKRKIFRRRERDASTGYEPSAPSTDTGELVAGQPPDEGGEEEKDDDDNDDVDERLSATGAVRRRRRLAERRGGVKFTAQQPSGPSRDLRKSGQATTIGAAADMVIHRFAPQTGQAIDISDKHMTAYIDAGLARMGVHRSGIPLESSTMPLQHTSGEQRIHPREARDTIQKQPATLGRLQEIDLGPDAQARNVALTEAATRRMQGAPTVVEEQLAQKPAKIRLGRNGKPIPPKRRRRRGSEDLARDSFVDTILSEARTDHVYDQEEDEHNDTPTDERLAEQFRADFMEQLEARNAQAAARAVKPQDTGPGKGGKPGDRDEYAKGPKLGGSRMQRAAMREKEMAAKGGPANRGGPVGRR